LGFFILFVDGISVHPRIIALACAFIVLAGCCDIITPTTCDPPYIKDGAVCCLDENNDGICDADEYECGDGSLASDQDYCPEPIVCDDGSLAYDWNECPPAELGPGHYSCNDRNEPPCDYYTETYCDKFTPTEINVRTAASEAIRKHPGAYSVNQLFDIYDWMKANVIYQNVPLDKSAPYYPDETLRTKSGDCKNQAVLVASMVEAIGGRANVRIVPECLHAFPVVYIGNDTASLNATFKAIRAHYPDARNQSLSYRYWTIDNETQYWLIFDTAGAYYPGTTLDDCLNATQSFEVYDCNFSETLRAPEIGGMEYGPWVITDETKILYDDQTYSFYVNPWREKTYDICSYNMTFQSLSGPMDWFVTTDEGYQDYINERGFSYYAGGANVQKGEYVLHHQGTEKFDIIIHNPGRNAMTVEMHIIQVCYDR
jgi:hypothetical protein